MRKNKQKKGTKEILFITQHDQLIIVNAKNIFKERKEILLLTQNEIILVNALSQKKYIDLCPNTRSK